MSNGRVSAGRRRGMGQHRLTAKGRATRERIVATASRLMLDRGVGRTTLADVQAAAQVSSSQLYHYFADKDALVYAVIELQTTEVLALQEKSLAGLDSFAALEAWRDDVLALQRDRNSMAGCPIGTLAGELSEADERARGELAQSFARWEELLRRGIASMRDRGELKPDVEPDRLALALLAAVQGGLLLSQTRRELRPLEVALDLAIAQIRALRT